MVNEKEELVENCEFYDIGADEEETILSVGVQMKPSLTGNGHGEEFCRAIINQGREYLNYNYLQLSVVEFNKRAQRVYERIGFKKIDETYYVIRGNEYKFIVMDKAFN